MKKTIKSGKNHAVTRLVGYFQTRPRVGVIALLVVLLVAAIGMKALFQGSAATSQIYLNPSIVSVQAGTTFTVGVRINPGGSVDSVIATLAYDPAKLEFIGIDASTSAFPTEFTSTGGNGYVTINRGIAVSLPVTYVTTDSLVANVTFKALANRRSTGLTLVNQTNATYDGAYTSPSVSGTTINFSKPPRGK